MAVIAYHSQHVEIIRWIRQRTGYIVLEGSSDLDLSGPHVNLGKDAITIINTWAIVMGSIDTSVKQSGPRDLPPDYHQAIADTNEHQKTQVHEHDKVYVLEHHEGPAATSVQSIEANLCQNSKDSVYTLSSNSAPLATLMSPATIVSTMTSNSSDQNKGSSQRKLFRRKAVPPYRLNMTARVLYDFEPEVDNDEELRIHEGDKLDVVEKSAALEEDGWCRARISGTRKVGLVPLEYLDLQSPIDVHTTGRIQEAIHHETAESMNAVHLRTVVEHQIFRYNSESFNAPEAFALIIQDWRKRPLPRGRLTIVFDCSWELPNTMCTQFGRGQTLAKVVTLTGDRLSAQATTCEDYILQFWPEFGSSILEAIDQYLASITCDVEIRKPTEPSMFNKGSVSISVHSSDVQQYTTRTQVCATAPLQALSDIAEVLGWLAATVRTSTSATLMLSRVQLIGPAIIPMHAAATFQLNLEPLKIMSEDFSMCWHPLFVHGILADQFPIPNRIWGRGLEISPFLMANLAGVIMPVEFRGGLILKGLSTALIPMEALLDEGAIQWHLLLTDSTQGTINVDENFCKYNDAKNLMTSKAYLGWCSVAHVRLGTIETDHSMVSWSEPVQKKKTLELSGLSFGIASSGMGTFGPSIVANFALAQNSQIRFMDIRQSLEDRLMSSKVRPVIIYDTSEKRGWLVPMVCALLHMMHLRLREIKKDQEHCKEKVAAAMPVAEGFGDGGQEAYKVMVQHLKPGSVTALGSSEVWTKTLSQFYVALDMALNESIQLNGKGRLYEGSEITGFELMDVVLADGPFRFSKRKVEKHSGGWAALAQHVSYVLYCSGLGDAIIPGSGSNSLCRSWVRMPPKSDYLCAYLPCLLEVLNRQGLHRSNRALSDASSGPYLYKECQHPDGLRCFHLHTYQSIVDLSNIDQERPRVSKTKTNTDLSVAQISPPEGRGAIIVGKITKITKAYGHRLPINGENSNKESSVSLAHRLLHR